MPGSEINTIEVFLGHYGGYIGLGLSLLVLFVLVPLRDRWLPSVLKQKELEHQQRLKQQEVEHQHRIKQIEEETQQRITVMREDVEFRRTIERDRAAAAKVTSDAIQALSGATQDMERTMALTNDRIATILVNQVDIQKTLIAILQALPLLASQQSLNEAVSDMKETVSRREGYEQRKRETGPLGEGGSKSE